MTIDAPPTLGLVLAGGLARRMGGGDKAMKRFPRARPISVNPTCRARSTPQAVKPDRETRMGIPIRTVLITISEVSRPVV